jgi:hypothetical protein
MHTAAVRVAVALSFLDLALGRQLAVVAGGYGDHSSAADAHHGLGEAASAQPRFLRQRLQAVVASDVYSGQALIETGIKEPDSKRSKEKNAQTWAEWWSDKWGNFHEWVSSPFSSKGRGHER